MIFNGTEELLNSLDPIAESYKNGHPMGSTVMNGSMQQPKFYITAERDTLSAPLDKIQIIKGWSAWDEDTTHASYAGGRYYR